MGKKKFFLKMSVIPGPAPFQKQFLIQKTEERAQSERVNPPLSFDKFRQKRALAFN